MELVYYAAASLDGHIATPEGGVDWLSPYEGGQDDYGYGDFYASVDCLVMGGRTYRHALGLGPWLWKDKATRVFTRQALHAPPPGVAAAQGSPGEVLAHLGQEDHHRAWLVGGGELAAACLAEGLITELILTTVPVVLGGGIPLFGGAAAGGLELVSSRVLGQGLVQNRYRFV
ncbi:MAG: dihydrofolate reductase family protein [bacterium]|jgi:dihydrofolate reductase|nr:dihydrofolate reductase family protein [bacterium]